MYGLMVGSIFRLVLVLQVWFAAQAHAATTYYYVDRSGYVVGQFSTPTLACQAAVDWRNTTKAPSTLPYTLTSQVMFPTGLGVTCTLDTPTSKNLTYTVLFDRRGDSCPSGSTFDSVTGICKSDNPCQALSGQMVKTVQNMGQDYPVVIGPTVTSACVNGCSVPMAVTVQTRCKQSAKTWDTYCLFAGFYDGLQCTAGGGNSPDCVGDACTAPEPQTVVDEKPCVYTTDAEGRKVCTSEWSKYADGAYNCGQVDGAWKCLPKDSGQSEQNKVDTKVTETSNPDGSKDQTKTDTQTTSVCTGAGACTSSTTTTVTVTHIAPDGTQSGSSSSCSGPNCPSTSSTGDTSNCPPGQTCDQSFKAPGTGDVPTFTEAVGKFKSAIESAPIVAAVSNISVPTGGSCSFPSASTSIGEIGMGPFCDLAGVLDSIRAVFLAVWGLAAVRVLMSA